MAARAVQGVGAALLLPGTLAIISRVFPERSEQARAIGVWAAVGSVALPMGPLVGGLLVQAWGWRWVFLLNIPIVLFAGVTTLRTVDQDSHRGRAELDWAGIGLGALSLASATFTVIEVGHSGVDIPAVVAGVVAVVALGGFLQAERTAEHPMLPLELVRRRGFATANAVAATMNFGTLGLLFLLTLFLQAVQLRSALAAGIAVLPLFLPLTLLAPVAGRATSHIGPKPVMVCGLVVAGVGVAFLATWSPGTPFLLLLPAMLAWGIGLAALTPAVVAAAIAAAPPERSGLASGVNNTARQAGGAIGIAAYGAIAGRPDHLRHFLTGLHLTGLATAGLFLTTAAVTPALLPSHQPEPADA